jgi:site-specific DNA recombinase
MWMGGSVPLGYEVKNRALVVNETEAKKVRLIFRRYVELGSVDVLADDLDRKCIRSHRRVTQDGRTIGGRPITRGNLYLILQNPIYLGMVVHKGTTYQGLQQPIIERETWERVQEQLAKNRVDHRKQTRARVPSLLTGLLFDSGGERLTPSHANRGGLRYRYYISKSLARGRPPADKQNRRWRIPAAEIENAVLGAVSSFLDDQSALSSILSLCRLPPAQTAGVLKTATAVSRSLSQDHAGQLRSTLQSILSRPRSEIQHSRSPSHWDGCVNPSSSRCILPTNQLLT